MRYQDLANWMQEKLRKTDTSKKDIGIGLGLTGLGGVALKGERDVGNIIGKADDWWNTIKPHTERLASGKGGIVDNLKAIEAYTQGGRNLVNSKVLGLPVGYIAPKAVAGVGMGQSLEPRA